MTFEEMALLVAVTVVGLVVMLVYWRVTHERREAKREQFERALDRRLKRPGPLFDDNEPTA